MDQEKIGTSIQEKRKDQNLTQMGKWKLFTRCWNNA